MKRNDEIIVNIEKLAQTGEGIARYGEEKFVIFVKNALPKEKLKVKIESCKKNFAKAEIIEILQASTRRRKPFCPLYNACGSCSFQICDYDYQIEQKTEILKEMFGDYIKDNIFPVIKSPKTLSYRHKIQFPARETKVSKRVLLGYFRENSHELTNIKFCPVQPEIMNKIAQFIRENYKSGCFEEKTGKGLLKHVIARISSKNDSILLTFVLNSAQEEFSEKFENEIFRFSKKIMAEFKEIKGIFANFNPKNSNSILGKETVKILGEDFIFENLGDKTFKIGAVSFFQVNPAAAFELFSIIEKNIKEDSTILDAYGGVGAIGIFASKKARKITLVEENQNAVLMARENFKLNNIENFEILEGDAKKHFADFESEGKTFDYAILDPPRAGIEKSALEAIAKCAKNIVYVSCNPATLKRDLKELLKLNFKPEFIQGADFFPFTHHIETLILFEKEEK